jgi:hypothetical protein
MPYHSRRSLTTHHRPTYYVILRLASLLLILIGLATATKVNKIKLIQQDKTRIRELICNDYKSRFSLNFTTSNRTQTRALDENGAARLRLEYKHEPCDAQTAECGFSPIFNFSDVKLTSVYNHTQCASGVRSSQNTLKFIVNTSYKYRFRLMLVTVSNNSKQDASSHEQVSVEEICEDMFENEMSNVKFTQCDEYELDVALCTFRLVKATPPSKFFIKYLYIFLGVVLVSFIVFKLIQVVFFRYKLVNN